jgi:hypothetical protein
MLLQDFRKQINAMKEGRMDGGLETYEPGNKVPASPGME